MGLSSLLSGALRSSSSRVLSTNTRYILFRAFSMPELQKPVAAAEAAIEPAIGRLARVRDPKGMTVLQACSVAGISSIHPVEIEKSATPVAYGLMAAVTALFLGLSSNPVLAEDASTELTEVDSSDSDAIGLRKIDDGSVLSNIHTSKWRVFTDNGRDYFLQGKLENAEQLFVGALQEAKEGFGERDPHVASSCNNLAELYRVKKEFNKAEPLYLEAVSILEESFGHEDIRVGAALHNLGQFYLVQRKLDEAHACYERALKIKRRVLGESHADYAETMYHLGKVLNLQGNGKDAEVLIRDSIQILEEGGQGESLICARRLLSLAQIYIKANKLTDAVNIQRKFLRTIEVSKGRDSMETVMAAESLALTLYSVGSLMEAKELLQRCLYSRKRLLSNDHIQIAANMLHIARVELLRYKQTSGDMSKAITGLDEAKDLLVNAIRIARQALDKSIKQRANNKSSDASRANTYTDRTSLLILLKALNALGQLEETKTESLEWMDRTVRRSEAEKALNDCISAYKEFGSQMSLSNYGDIKTEYLSCLKHLHSLIRPSGLPSLKEMENDIKKLEAELQTPNTKPIW